MPGQSARQKRTPRVAETFVNPRLAAWTRLMDEGVSNSTILVVGDSTGVGTTRWPYLLAQYIAQQWPAWTVIWAPWDDPSKTYPAGSRVTIQTGTNGQTLTIWNASVSGQVIAYARDNYTTITSGLTPDLIFFNYAHNSPQIGDAYRYIHAETFLRYQNMWPKAAVVSIVQNPRDPVIWATASPTYAQDQQNQRAVYEFSVAQGVPVVDVNAAFRAIPNFGSVLLNADGLHPNDSTGSPLWASLVWNVIKPTGSRALASGHQPSSTRVWIPASQFYAVDGTPTLGVTANGIQYWSLPNGAISSVVALVDIPTAWLCQNIHIITTAGVAGTTGNQVIIAGAHQYVGSRYGLGGSVTLGGFITDATVTTSGVYTVGKTFDLVIWDRITLGSSPVALKVQRVGTNASDTFANPVQFLGLMIEQAF